MTELPVRLKVLLRERHWQTYRTFCSQYDKAARAVDPELVGGWPSRAQLHRWLSGEVKGLPYPDHCRILEEMFPGWTAAQLFERYPANGRDARQEPSAAVAADANVNANMNAEEPAGEPPAQEPAAQEPSAQWAGSRTADVGRLLGIIEGRLGSPASDRPAWGSVRRVPGTAGAGLRSVSEVLGDRAFDGFGDHARELGRRLLELQQLRRFGDDEIRELAGLSGHVVELTATTYVHIDAKGRATVACRIELLNLTDEPVVHMTREVSFDHTTGPLDITSTPDSDRRLKIELINDTADPGRFTFEIFPPLRPGESTRLGFVCENGRFKGDNRWHQTMARHTRQYTLRIRQQNVVLGECTAVEEQPDGSESPATDGLMWDTDGDDVVITVTRDHLRPDQALTLRWK